MDLVCSLYATLRLKFGFLWLRLLALIAIFICLLAVGQLPAAIDVATAAEPNPQKPAPSIPQPPTTTTNAPTLNRITQVSTEIIQSQLILKIVASSPLNYIVKTLIEPYRIYIDLLNCDINQIEERELEILKGVVERIRIGQFTPEVARVVIDLTEETNYEIAKSENKKELILGIDLKIKYEPQQQKLVKFEAIQLLDNSGHSAQKQQQVCKFVAKLSAPTQFSTFTLFQPTKRFVVDLQPAIFAATKKELPVDNQQIYKVRMSQFQSKPLPIVRLVFDLKQVLHATVKPEENKLLISFEPTKLSGKLIIIDPGHGGQDPGAIGINALKEKDVNLDIALKLEQLLSEAIVVMARTDDIYVSLAERVELANNKSANAFISIHCNSTSIPDSNYRGTQTYYYNSHSFGLAKALHQSLLAKLNLPDGGIRKKGFYVIKYTTAVPSVLIECAFINNPVEGNLLSQPEFRQKVAEAIYEGLLEWFESQSRR